MTPGAGPARPDIGVVALVADVWTPDYWMARHQIMTRLARAFHVVWLDRPLGWRAALRPQGLDVPRARTGAITVPGMPPGFVVLHPGRWLPDVVRPAWLRNWLGRTRLRYAQRVLRRRGVQHIVYYLWRPQFAWALEVPGARAAVYHVVDDYSFSAADPPVSPEEARLLRAVDQVIVHSPGLVEKRGRYNPRTALIPNGVDFAAFSTPQAIPADLAAIPGPRIGYVGFLKKTLDLPLLVDVARRHPAWSFVLVGRNHLPPGADEPLRQLPNVHLLGARRRAELGAYVQHMDVCILPYVLDGYTKYIYPLKLHEYLAAGRAVVSTPLRSLLEHRGVVTLAQTADEWSQALTAAVASNGDRVAAEGRRAVARAHDWDGLVEKIAALIGDRVAGESRT